MKSLPKFPLIVIGIGLAGYAAIASQTELDSNMAGVANIVTTLVTALLMLIWFVLFSGFGKAVRFGTLAAVVVLGVAARFALTVEGSVDGTGRPNFTWVWKKRTPIVLPSHATEAVADIAPTVIAAKDVTQFLGPDRNGFLTGSNLDHDWAAHPPRELWRIPMGEGWGAFTVIGGRAYTQEQRQNDECVSCYDLATGKLVWVHGDLARFVEWQGGDGPRATPTYDDGKLYTLGATGIFNCIDAASGKVVWRHELMVDHKMGNIMWGFASSPLILDDMVIVTGTTAPGPTVMAYAKSDGTLRWKAGTTEGSYASPSVATIAGRRMLIVNTAASLMLLDPSKGEVLMEHPWGTDKWPRASQPVVLPGDKLFISAGYGMGCELFQIKLTDTGTPTFISLWQGHKMKTQFNSVTPIGDVLYGLDDGRMAAVDVATGERLWKETRYGAGQHLIVDGIALIQAEKGDVVLAELKREGLKEIATLPALKGKTWNYPTLAGRHLLVRNDREAACYELPLEP